MAPWVCRRRAEAALEARSWRRAARFGGRRRGGGDFARLAREGEAARGEFLEVGLLEVGMKRKSNVAAVRTVGSEYLCTSGWGWDWGARALKRRILITQTVGSR